ncbi:hypothetical protein D6850_12955 [Roseovarius spongiae]|uniref:HdeA/HdeB family protein n=2 Tax=Roseovarius spongiae TaxID=2320272 RepID=A0A3A8AV74_9RHOB|nr:hypothetical protein D6850_12955 [Roseovarius spongiae]
MKTTRIGVAVLGIATLTAQGAFAMDDDMSCGDFMKMSEADQTAYVGAMAGPEAERETTEAEVQAETTGDATDIEGSGGRENAQDEARGDDDMMMKRIVENCSSDMDKMVSEVAHHPTEKTE